MSIWNHIIPSPAAVTPLHGGCTLRLPLAVAVETGPDGAVPGPSGASGAIPGRFWSRLNAAARRVAGVDLATAAPEDPAAGGTPTTLEFDGGMDDAYRLSVGPDGIHIVYADAAGLAAAFATFTQGVMLHGGVGAPIPAVSISDRAASEWRGFMLDVARTFFPLESLERFADILWLLRLNRFHLHLTDDQGWRMPVPGYPRLTEVGAWRPQGTSDNRMVGGAYTADELRQFDGACAALGITVVPEIDLPGHASAAFAAYPELACGDREWRVETRWGIFPSVVCATEPAGSAFLEAVYDAATAIFDGPYVHVGGDEVPEEPWRECPGCRDLANPYQTIVRRMADAVVARGRRPVVWDEASALDLPESTIVVNWRGPEGAKYALRGGYDLILAPEGKAAYLDHQHLDSSLEPGRLGVCRVADSAAFSPVSYAADHDVIEGAGDAAANQQGGPTRQDDVPGRHAPRILGGQANLWTEAVTSHRAAEYMAIVRLAAIAEGLWAGAPADRSPDFTDRLAELRRILTAQGYNLYPGPFA